ncbi:hypothetical protein [Falsiruegeria mediterranea]|uniref:Uncharacterized protein n=1 Tax=Falsiruegeria mediterranea M17 TaxID=1200281 RepID=A0A2R8C917_9RHOB|nr:hypothetical protein [Falsiruegeria mediterranea]SPJ28930.1 hypothetical protein TRM7615_02439 [Falsiruegeria mediterranea M17]
MNALSSHLTRLFGAICLFVSAMSASAQDVKKLEAAAQASLGGPGSASAQQEQDRLRRLEESRWPGLDRALDPIEQSLGRFRENTGLALSFDYQALY